jgi:hypothetical protein
MENINNKSMVDKIAPAAIEVNSNFLKLGDKLVKTLFIFSYPRFLSTGWFSAIINMPDLIDIPYSSIRLRPIWR